MNDNSKSFIQHIIEGTDLRANIMRYCLSDQVPLKLDAIVSDIMSPIEYASKIIATKNKEIQKAYYTGSADVASIPPVFLDAWVFDQLALAAATYRLIMVRPDIPDTLNNFIGNAATFLLNTKVSKVPAAAFCGMTSYKTFSEKHFSTGKTLSPKNEYLTADMENYIGDMSEPEWFLHQPMWKETYLRQPSLINALRNFLHAFLSSFFMQDEHIEEVFNLSRLDLMCFAHDFIECRKRNDIKLKDVKEFARRLIFNFEHRQTNTIYHFLFDGPFSIFEQIHHQRFPLVKQPPSLQMWSNKTGEDKK